MKPRAQPLDWTPAVRDREAPLRSRFLESHIDLVRYVALRLHARLPAGVDADDLIHDGVLGLIEATDRYDPDRAVRFRTYAEQRVRGAILDGLRQKDWRPRGVRRLRRQFDEALAQIAADSGREPSDEELAEALGLDARGFHAALRDINSGPLLSLEDHGGADPRPAGESERPDAALDRRELIEALADEIDNLPERERRVLELYYHESLNMKEVGAVLGVTESRVCQVHAQAASRLRRALDERLHARAPVRAGRS